jgi:hypothetical protein
MDSQTYRRPTADQRRSASGEHHRLADTRYPHGAHFSLDSADNDDVFRPAYRGEDATDRVRAAMLIVIAVVALSAIAAIGWLQYQSDADDRVPHFEISEPDRSVPADVDGAAR